MYAIRSYYVDVRRQSPFEPAANAVLEAGEALRRPVGGEHQLLAGLVQRVERVEELLEDLFLAFQELDIVEEEHVHAPVPRLELVHPFATDAVDESYNFV